MAAPRSFTLSADDRAVLEAADKFALAVSCAQLSGPVVTVVESGQAGYFSDVSATAECPANYRALGGGIDVERADTLTSEKYRISASHPDGFDMMIGERGDSLSGGQRQGVAIARAFLMDPPILLLDEPTSAMDFSSEQQFKERLKVMAAHKTVLIVTHRNSLLDLATRVLVVDDGRIVADGPRDQVIQALQSGRIGRAS